MAREILGNKLEWTVWYSELTGEIFGESEMAETLDRHMYYFGDEYSITEIMNNIKQYFLSEDEISKVRLMTWIDTWVFPEIVRGFPNVQSEIRRNELGEIFDKVAKYC